jgi:diketogulonate reductase-like aldo/keto reductase
MKAWIICLIVALFIVIISISVFFLLKASPKLNCRPWALPPWSNGIAYGTYKRKGKEGQDLVRCALDSGYRIIDNAQNYGNEDHIGQVVQQSKIPRSDLVLITKVPSIHIGRMEEKLENSASLYGTDYMDVYMLHDKPDHFEDTLITWKRLLRLKEKGRVKLVGMTNVSKSMLEKIGKATGKLPMIVEVSLQSIDDLNGPLAKFCRKYGIVRLYFGVTNPRHMNHPKVLSYSREHSVSPTCAVIQMVRAAGGIPVIGSSNPEHIQQNFKCFSQ